MAADALRQAEQVAVLSGAGISKESGVPTFRDAQDGLWAKYDPSELATPQAFQRNPDLVWQWYMYRYDLITAVRANPGHYAVADLEDFMSNVVVLTQNIDGLHAEAGSSDIVELHGNIRRFKCFDNCQGTPTLVDLAAVEHDKEHAPECPRCGKGLLRPDVVWFGEVLPEAEIGRSLELSGNCDVMLIVGTSGLVTPAALLPYNAKRAGAVLIEVNPQPSMLTSDVDIYLQGPSGEVLPTLVGLVRG